MFNINKKLRKTPIYTSKEIIHAKQYSENKVI